MRKQASFEQYIKDKQYNEIYRAIQNYTYQNKDRMNLSTYAVPEASRFDIDTFEVMGTTFKEGIGDQCHLVKTLVAEGPPTRRKGDCYVYDRAE